MCIVVSCINTEYRGSECDSRWARVTREELRGEDCQLRSRVRSLSRLICEKIKIFRCGSRRFIGNGKAASSTNGKFTEKIRVNYFRNYYFFHRERFELLTYYYDMQL